MFCLSLSFFVYFCLFLSIFVYLFIYLMTVVICATNSTKTKSCNLIDLISKKIIKCTAIISRIRHFTNLNSLKLIYYALVYPYLIHCNLVESRRILIWCEWILIWCELILIWCEWILIWCEWILIWCEQFLFDVRNLYLMWAILIWCEKF